MFNVPSEKIRMYRVNDLVTPYGITDAWQISDKFFSVCLKNLVFHNLFLTVLTSDSPAAHRGSFSECFLPVTLLISIDNY